MTDNPTPIRDELISRLETLTQGLSQRDAGGFHHTDERGSRRVCLSIEVEPSVLVSCLSALQGVVPEVSGEDIAKANNMIGQLSSQGAPDQEIANIFAECGRLLEVLIEARSQGVGRVSPFTQKETPAAQHKC